MKKSLLIVLFLALAVFRVSGQCLTITNPLPVCSPATVNITAGSVTAGSAATTFTYWQDSGATTPYTTPTTATAGTYYIKGADGTGCPDVKAVVVTVDTPPSGGTLTPSPASICSGSTSTLTLSGYAGTIEKWQKSEDGGTTWTDIAHTAASYSATALTDTTKYRVVLGNGSCPDDTSTIATVIVNTPPTGGTLTASPASICSGSNSTLTLSGYAGTIEKWQKSGDGGTTWTDIAHTAASYSATALTDTTKYRVVLGNGSCPDDTSTIATVIVNAPPTGGTLTASLASVCSDSTSVLTLTGYFGTIEKWQKSADGGSTWTDIANTTNSYTTDALTGTTKFRVVVGNSTCADDISTVATVTISPVGGTLTASPVSICSGSNSTITLTGYAGTIEKWQKSQDGGSTWTDIVHTTASYTATALTDTTRYRVVLGNGSCPDDTSSIADVNVSIPPSGGTLTPSPASICSGSNSTITLSGYSGTIEKWQKSEDGGSTWTDIAHAAASYTATSLTTETKYRVVVGNAPCDDDTSTIATVAVSAPPSGGSLSPAAANVCSGTNSTTITLSGHSSSIVKWEYSVDGGSTWNNIVNTSTTETATNLVATTRYHAVIEGGVCPDGTSSASVITVLPINPVSVTIASGDNPSCAGTNVTFTPTPANGGTSPVYQWYVNNVAASAGATYTYKPSNGDKVKVVLTSNISCPGGNPATSNEITQVVDTLPDITDMTYSAVCDAPFSIVPVKITNGIVPAGTIYSWPLPTGDSKITEESAGINQTSISDSLHNSKNDNRIMTYIVTPSNGGCTNPSNDTFSIVVTVQPKPSISAKSATTCSGVLFNVTPVDNSETGGDVVPAGTTYRWNIPSMPAGVSGASGATGVSSISGTLANSSTSSKTVTYSVTPTAGGHDGVPFNVVITVQPAAQVADPADLVVCNNTPVAVSFTTSNSGGVTTYSWTNSNTAIGLVASGTGNVSFTTANPTASQITGTITVTPSFEGCPANPQNFTVTVNPSLTLTGASLESPVFAGQTAKIIMTGTLTVPSQVQYTIGTDPTIYTKTINTADGSFITDPLTIARNGKMLHITSISMTGSPFCSNTFTRDVMLVVFPSPVITGPAQVCAKAAGVTYYGPEGMDTYNWTITNGTKASESDNHVTVNWGSTTPGTVALTCIVGGNSSSATPLSVTINSLPLPTISSDPSLINVCKNSTKVYTSQSGKSNYVWSVTGGTINGPVDGSSLSVTWTSTGYKNLSVTYKDEKGCQAESPDTLWVNVNDLPPVTITTDPNPSTPRVGATVKYMTQPGMTGYSWTFTSGGSGGPTTNDNISITWNASGNQKVWVNYVDANGCSAAEPALYNITSVYPLPVVSNVQISTPYPGVGYSLTGSYLYDDKGGGGSDNCQLKWFRDGALVSSGSTSYLLTLADTNHVITFSVVPRSTIGPPYEGTMVTSAPTLPIEQMGGLPVADQVCIEGTRGLANILRGKYRYTYTKPEYGSLYEWVRRDTVTHSDAVVGHSITYKLDTADIADNIDIIFRVQPVSSNFIPRTGLQKESQPLAKILLEKDTYSTKEPAVPLIANRMGGVFTGRGVTDGTFDPYIAGAGGYYTINYYRNVINTSHICAQRAYDSVRVSADVAFFTGFPFPSPICQSAGELPITANGVPPGAWALQFLIDATDGIKSQSGTNATIDLTKLHPDKTYNLTFSYIYAFSPYKINQSFTIDSVSTEIKIVNLDSAYCDVSGRKYISTEGLFPAGGTGQWTGSLFVEKNPGSAYFNPGLGDPGTYYKMSYQYFSPKMCPSKVYNFRVKINPLPDPGFLLNATYNYDGGPDTLEAVQPGGDFIGKGVTGNVFYPDLAGENEHIIRYSITDKATGCFAMKDDTTRVRKAEGSIDGMPETICYNDTTFHVTVSGLPAGSSGFKFTNTKNSIDFTADPKVINYGVVKAGPGSDKLRFEYFWDGVKYWKEKEIVIDKLSKPAIVELTPDTVICNDQKPFKLNTTIPGGVFEGPVVGGYFDPASSGRNDTVKYIITNPETMCRIDTALAVHVYPAPDVNFEPLDICIDSKTDITSFRNLTTPADSIASWKWLFADERGDQKDTINWESGHLYSKGGWQKITLTATTNMGCKVTKEKTYYLVNRPEADFYVKKDCFHPGEYLLLVDSTVSGATPKGWEWKVNGVVIDTTDAAEYLKSGTGYLNIQYVVKTGYPKCNDTVDKDIFIRPTIAVMPDGYFEGFEGGSNGWTKSDTANIWAFGTPNGTTIKTASSGYTAWFTDNTRSGAAFVESPCFDFSGTSRPVVEMDLFRVFEKDRDGTALQYRIGDDMDWQLLGTIDDGIEWYNSAAIRGKPGEGNQVGWTTTGAPDDKWKEAFHTADYLSGKEDVRFRIAYGSEGSIANHDGFAFDNFRIGERSRHVLVEHFTNNTDEDASIATTLIDTISNHRKNDVINIQYHTNFPGSDPFFEHNRGDASARILFYGLTKIPYTFVDGGTNNKFAMIFDNSMAKIDSNIVTKRSLVSSKFDIFLDAEVSGNVLNISGSIKAMESITNTGNLTLFIAVTEKRNVDNYTDVLGKKIFQNVFRKFIPDAGGIVLKKNSWAAGETLEIEEKTWLIDKILNNTDIVVIAFLQNPMTKEVYQAVRIEKERLVVGIPEFPSSGPAFSIYPNPAHDRFTIDFGDLLGEEADIIIYDVQGVPARTYKAGAGSSEITIENSGLKGGIYLVRVSSGGVTSAFRKLVITSD